MRGCLWAEVYYAGRGRDPPVVVQAVCEVGVLEPAESLSGTVSDPGFDSMQRTEASKQIAELLEILLS